MAIKIGGLQKMTLLDFPGRVACTLFTVGCNWRCPFCHNASLAKADGLNYESLTEEEVLRFLERRRGVLDGIAVTGGEPLLHPDLPAFLRRCRALGYAVKLDTNGTSPDRLKALCEEGLVDYVAMDIKNSPEKYAKTCGTEDCGLAQVRESVSYLMHGKVPFEFRTTVVSGLHTAADFEQIGAWIAGPEPYFLQAFSDSGELMCEGMHGVDKDEMQRFLAVVKPYLPQSSIRGE